MPTLNAKALVVALSLQSAVALSSEEIALEGCADIGSDFRIAPYLRVASSLQDQGEGRAIKQLRAWARFGKHEDQVIILCRMLFDVGASLHFRNPRLGAPVFFGGANGEEWPLVPVAIHKNVPILVTRGYFLAGVPESSGRYLEYCIANCRWSEARFTLKTDEELEAIVEDWVSSTEWPEALKEWDREFFLNQAKLAKQRAEPDT